VRGRPRCSAARAARAIDDQVVCPANRDVDRVRGIGARLRRWCLACPGRQRSVRGRPVRLRGRGRGSEASLRLPARRAARGDRRWLRGHVVGRGLAGAHRRFAVPGIDDPTSASDVARAVDFDIVGPVRRGPRRSLDRRPGLSLCDIPASGTAELVEMFDAHCRECGLTARLRASPRRCRSVSGPVGVQRREARVSPLRRPEYWTTSPRHLLNAVMTAVCEHVGGPAADRPATHIGFAVSGRGRCSCGRRRPTVR
jgi:hypothetical protein